MQMDDSTILIVSSNDEIELLQLENHVGLQMLVAADVTVLVPN